MFMPTVYDQWLHIRVWRPLVSVVIMTRVEVQKQVKFEFSSPSSEIRMQSVQVQIISTRVQVRVISDQVRSQVPKIRTPVRLKSTTLA